MISTGKFIMSHHLKLWWKLMKHGMGVLLMVNDRESKASPLNSGDDVFGKYLDSTRDS